MQLDTVGTKYYKEECVQRERYTSVKIIHEGHPFVLGWRRNRFRPWNPPGLALLGTNQPFPYQRG